MTIPSTPTLDKLADASDRRQAALDFIEWLGEEGIRLAEYQKIDGYRDPMLLTHSEPHDALVMRWLGLDPKIVEQERRALLEAIRP